MGTYTTNYNLFMPSIGEQGWGDLVNGNFSTIDTTMKGLDTRVGTLETEGDAIAARVTDIEQVVSNGGVNSSDINNSGIITSDGGFVGDVSGFLLLKPTLTKPYSGAPSFPAKNVSISMSGSASGSSSTNTSYTPEIPFGIKLIENPTYDCEISVTSPGGSNSGAMASLKCVITNLLTGATTSKSISHNKNGNAGTTTATMSVPLLSSVTLTLSYYKASGTCSGYISIPEFYLGV